MTFSVNQVRQLYVAKEFKTPKVLSTDKAGAIAVKSDNVKSHLYFEYKGADNLMRSDLIDIKNILYAKATNASKMTHNLKSYTVVLDPSVNGGVPVSGQDYILRIAFRQYIGMSEEDQYFKYGVVHAYAGMTASEFYAKLALSLAKNFSRETTKLLTFKLVSGDLSSPTDEGEVTPLSKIKPYAGASGTFDVDPYTTTYTGIVINEVEQPWRLGVMQQVPVYFTVQPTTITVSGDEVIWGRAKETNPAGTIKNGKTIADLEYFCMGERGDMYRQISWPHNITTTYLVDPESEYHVFDIHYAFVDKGVSVQKSEKTITIVCNSTAEMNKIIGAFNTATGMTVATL